MIRILPLAFLLACGQNRDFGGQDLGGDKLDANDDGVEEPGDTDTVQSTDFGELLTFDDTTCDEGATGTTPQELRLTGGVGTIAISHVGVVDQCCAEWAYEYNIEAFEVSVTYFDVSEDTCNCVCPWTLDYTLSDMAPGDWTVTAEGDEKLVSVY